MQAVSDLSLQRCLLPFYNHNDWVKRPISMYQLPQLQGMLL